MMIEFKISYWCNETFKIKSILLNPNTIAYIDPISEYSAWIYFSSDRSILINHSYDEIVKKIEVATGCLRLKDEITSFEEFKKE